MYGKKYVNKEDIPIESQIPTQTRPTSMGKLFAGEEKQNSKISQSTANKI